MESTSSLLAPQANVTYNVAVVFVIYSGVPVGPYVNNTGNLQLCIIKAFL